MSVIEAIKQRIRRNVSEKWQITIPFDIREDREFEEVICEERFESEDGDMLVYFIDQEEQTKKEDTQG